MRVVKDMGTHKRLRAILWLSGLLDVAIVVGLALKMSRAGMGGLSAWFRRVHFIPVSATSGRATYLLRPDHRFTLLYLALMLVALALNLFAVWAYLRSRADRGAEGARRSEPHGS